MMMTIMSETLVYLGSRICVRFYFNLIRMLLADIPLEAGLFFTNCLTFFTLIGRREIQCPKFEKVQS